jgi:lipopolysaccharide transport system ATP-binding protein
VVSGGSKKYAKDLPMSSDMIAIQVEHISKSFHIYAHPQDRLKQFLVPRLQRLMGKTPRIYYHEFWALNDVSFEVKKGETVGIIGRNGSGKSTLLQLICGTLTPTSGTVRTNGRVAALLELGSGFNLEFTGRENVYLNGSVLGLSMEEINARFDAIVAFADIGEFIEQPVKTYSSGMFVRLAFAVIAHVDADILVIDEALSVGDAVFTQKCGKFLKNFCEEGTLLFVSHSSQSILDLCDRSIWLSNGESRQDGVAKDVVRNYTAYVHQESNPTVNVTVTDKAAVTDEAGDSKKIGLDMRKDLLTKSNLQFKIKVFDFDFDSADWGAGGAKIINLEMIDAYGKKLTIIDDCGLVLIRVHCLAAVELAYPVVGISIRNHRGVYLISQNSYLAHAQNPPPHIKPGEEFFADFKLFLPYLAAGEYTLGAAIADGIPENHIQHHKRDDALLFTVINTHVVYGLFAMPLEDCRVYVNNAEKVG